MPTPEEIQTCIDNLTTSSTKEDFVVLAAEAKAANTGVSFSVAAVNDLPDLELVNIGDGQIVFVESISVQVMSLGFEWIGLDGRVLRRDADYTELYAWGNGLCGNLGDGTTTDKYSPVREISQSTNWCQVSAGGAHSSAVKTNGTIWSWGIGTCGRLGDGTTVAKCSPVQEISSSTNWCQVGAGSTHSTAIKTDGTLWGWGSGSCGRLGDGTAGNRCSPVQEISSSTNWYQVSAGCCHSSAVKTDGTLWSWGSSNCGQLGDGTITSKCSPVQEISSSTNWCQVSTTRLHSSAVKTDGTIWSWGWNTCGVLGDGTIVDRCSPVQEISSSTNWCQVSAGGAHSSAVKTNGTIWSWGTGICGRLGDGTLTDKCSPVQEISSSTNWCQVSAGFTHSSAVKTGGTLWSWGAGQCGKTGIGVTINACSPVQEITSSTNWCQVSSGVTATAALKIFLEPT